MTPNEKVAPVVAAFAAIGATLLDQHKAQLEKMVENVADDDARKAMTALADHITMHGLAGAAQTPLRNAVTGAEDDFVGIINANIEGGVDAFDNWLKSVAAGSAP